jgi:hypothetical protein
MASLRWHTMNNVIADIERNRERINAVSVHCSMMKHSTMRSKLKGLRDEQNQLYDSLFDNCEEWLKYLRGEKIDAHIEQMVKKN